MSTTDKARASAVFATTRWTRVLAAGGESSEARAALSDLCSAYYEPVVKFLHARFRDEDRARELAHSFFARLLEKNNLSEASPERGRFRSYLLGAVKHFAADVHAREHAAKRGKQHEHVAIGEGTDTSPGVDPPEPDARPVELEFDRQWALTLLDHAIKQLEEEQRNTGNFDQFELLKPWLSGGGMSSQATVAEKLGMNEGAVKVAIHRLRKRFREIVKSEIAQTVPETDDVQEELQYLMLVVSG